MIYVGDCVETLRTLSDKSVHTCVTSPPYWGLRDYGADGQIGLEETPEAYVERLVGVFREVKRVLRDDGTLWLNLGDSYAVNRSSGQTKVFGNPDFNGNRPSRAATKLGKTSVPDGLKPKDLVGIPWRVAFALQQDGWYLRSDIVWHKLNAMPESVKDRPTKAHEYIFLLSKSQKYYYDAEAVKEPIAESTKGRGKVYFGGKKGREYTPQQGDPNYRGGNEQWGRLYEYKEGGRNRRTVWSVSTKPFKGAHFATFPIDLIEPCVLAGCPEGGVVLDPFFGAGTTGIAAHRHKRDFVGIELNDEYTQIAEQRLCDEDVSVVVKSLEAVAT